MDNTKLDARGIVSFGLPAGFAANAFNTCPAKGICAGYCFARQGFYVFPWVAKVRDRNLAIARAAAFGPALLKDLELLAPAGEPRDRRRRRRKRITTIRVHDSGDFFSLRYLRLWYAAARAFPELRFYAYTKMFKMLAPAIWDERPKNFSIVQSVGSLDDEHIDLARPHARVFVDHADRETAGYVDGLSSEEPAITGELKIGLVYHSSNRPLTPGQAKALRVLP